MELLADGSHPGSATPRLSHFLRVAVWGEQPFDVDGAHVARSHVLAASRDAQGQPPSSLAVRLFGPTGLAGAPSREARFLYTSFLTAAGRLLGSDLAPDQLAAAAEAAYDALVAAADTHEAAAALKASLLGPSFNAQLVPAARDAALALAATARGLSPSGGAAKQPRGVVFGSGVTVMPPVRDSSWLLEASAVAAVASQPAARATGSPASPASLELAPGASEETALQWFRSQCASVASSGAWGASAWEDVARMAAGVMLRPVPDEDAAGELFELFGHASVATIAALVGQRARVADALRPRLAALKLAMGYGDDGQTDGAMEVGGDGGSLRIATQAQRDAEKARRKDLRRATRQAGGGGKASADPLVTWLLSTRGIPFGALFEGATQQWAAPSSGSGSADPLAGLFGTGEAALRAANPLGMVREVHPGWESYTVPPPAKLAPTDGLGASGELFPIAQLAPWERTPFEGYTTLNRVQTAIEPVARRGACNLLVCAPTGAGKTNIAMLAVLRELALRRRGGGTGDDLAAGAQRDGADDGGDGSAAASSSRSKRSSAPQFDVDDMKIVYVAPMKALAAEVAAAFGRRLGPLGLRVREFTGDMQLTRAELSETHMLVVTPEKWDVVTRKGGEGSAASACCLLILDEVHLLAEERGAVLEALVARTRRQVEAQQRPIRLLGLSATLPNPGDVASFLGVPPQGLFVFDARYRPVPLTQKFVGVSETNPQKRLTLMNQLAWDECISAVRRGKQAMVFVHSRADTGRTARALAELAAAAGQAEAMAPDAAQLPDYDLLAREVAKCRSREVQELAPKGFGIHHAGLLRPDRALTERLFARGYLKVLVCTATLAWGVNLPAHTVVIKGTQVYDASQGGFKDLGLLDVAQIFGRAGRPQFDDSGEGVIITQHGRLAHYLGMLTAAVPIESRFMGGLKDNLNAECVLGTVTDVAEGAAWLSHTFLAVRAARNPLAYALTWQQVADDPGLGAWRARLIREAARQLDAAKLMRFDERTGQMYTTDSGRVAAQYYLRCSSMETYLQMLQPHMALPDLFAMVAKSTEFENLTPREEEMSELEELARGPACPVDIAAGLATKEGKANCLIQAYISRARLEAFSLVADTNYVAQSVDRICRALAELVLRKGWPGLGAAMLTLAKAADRRLWPQQHPLRQFEPKPGAWQQQGGPREAGGLAVPADVMRRLEDKGEAGSLERLTDMEAAELAALSRSNPQTGARIAACVNSFPWLEMEAAVQPLTRTVLRVSLSLWAPFTWRESAHGGSLRWHVWVEDQDHEHIYHYEVLSLSKRQHATKGGAQLAFTIPVFEPMPPQYYIRCVSDSWLGSENTLELSLRDIVLPRAGTLAGPTHTELLHLRPLPRSALRQPAYEALYAGRFTHFNAVQTQAFHTLYCTDASVLLGAPTGSGKTVSAELVLLRSFATSPGRLVVYIAPLKALVRERVQDWRQGLCAALGKRLVELTGDTASDSRALDAADLVVTTPEKWDAVSRGWNRRACVRRVTALVIDEIHLLGADRGPVLEVLVSRMRYIAAATGTPLRVVGLSTALANAGEVGAWLGVPAPTGLFNFKPSVRPVPLEVHIQGYPGAAYCPRMAAMNKPTYGAIKAHSPHKPTLVFVSSRRQTRLTALELLALAAADDSAAKPQFLGDGVTLQQAAGWGAQAVDPALAHCLPHGVAMHHAGLPDGDRQLVEALFAGQKVRVLVCTATLAWGVNLPAHLVVVKGTEYYDGATRRYVDFPITDVLQMMGRAGRPQFDTSGCAVILAHEPKKAFYKKFLYEPFPVESSLHLPGVLADHLNAEVAAGTVTSIQDGLDFLSWSYLFRRVPASPSFYGCAGSDDASVDAFFSNLVLEALESLQEAGCVEVAEGDEGDGETVESIFGDDGDNKAAPKNPGWKAGAEKRRGAGQQQQQQLLLTRRLAGTPIGRIIASFYLRHRSASVLAEFASGAGSQSRDVRGALAAVCACAEFDELPVRHNEELSNATLADAIASAGGWPPLSAAMDDPHVKTQLLLQAHMLGLAMPVSDYVTDLRSAMDNAPRVVQAAVEVAVQRGNAAAALAAMRLAQCLAQGVHPGSAKGKGKQVPQPRGAPVALSAQVSGDQLRVTATVTTALALAPGATRQKGSTPGTGWWLCAVDATTGRLWAVKRVSLDARRRDAATTVALALAPEAAGPGSALEVHLVSDSLQGVDAVTRVAKVV